jgi:hypothetical protein
MDGNVVLYRNSDWVPLWASNSGGNQTTLLSMQTDGNLVLYDQALPVWHSHTAGNPGAYLAIQDDCNLVIYDSTGAALASADTGGCVVSSHFGVLALLQCAPVTAAPPVDPWSVRIPSAGFGGIFTDQSSGFTDVFLRSPTDYIRVGARLDWGGAIVFFGLAGGANVIDDADTGREMQIALYDPPRQWQVCARDASCGAESPCGEQLTYFGWNPVQGGDECNSGTPILGYGQVGDALQIIAAPVQWNPDWDAPDCRQTDCSTLSGVLSDVRYVFELRFVAEHVVEVMTTVINDGDLDHGLTGQEFPCLYTAFGEAGLDLSELLDASGREIVIDEPFINGLYEFFESPEPWVSYQNTDWTYGVGMAADQGIHSFVGCTGGPGTSQPAYYHYVRSIIGFGIPPRSSVRGLTYLALGNFETVRYELRRVLERRPPFGKLDFPAQGVHEYPYDGEITVAGWVLDTWHVDEVQVQIDGNPVASLPVNVSRLDVCKVYPGYAGCPAVGFASTISTAGLSACPHLLRISATDRDGNTTILGERVIQPSDSSP